MAGLVELAAGAFVAIALVLGGIDALFGQPRDSAGRYQTYRLNQFVGLVMTVLFIGIAAYIYVSF
ncbi:hypothetical protein [Halopelagius longus]|uniref:Uncharacterized protein n=1 Tax=Halopelagius longus TaxID=1236180 RepID=A0A1H0YSY0_9EURY|nr:hypothetical protein [Halopelagius longus]RDI72663.1 hypothetical protein DWB78_13545 [Halopelagius longus]SDQ18284.1 hypothetical protein SAMN05216278_0825 [Halopelagius longus]